MWIKNTYCFINPVCILLFKNLFFLFTHLVLHLGVHISFAFPKGDLKISIPGWLSLIFTEESFITIT